MSEHLHGYPYSQDVITRLHVRAESYRQSGPSAEHTADLLDEAAGCISALLADLNAYRLTMDRIAEAASENTATGSGAQADDQKDQANGR